VNPLLFLDVDGPLNPYLSLQRPPAGYTMHRFTPNGVSNGLPVLLNHSHGEELNKLGYDLVWATSWEDEANEFIGPHIGLPKLPVVKFEIPVFAGRKHWKTDHLIAYADGRPFVWVDDECTSADWDAIKALHGENGDIYRADPRTGLNSSDFYLLARKAQEMKCK
jgi:hypothetical protein